MTRIVAAGGTRRIGHDDLLFPSVLYYAGGWLTEADGGRLGHPAVVVAGEELLEDDPLARQPLA